MRQHIRWAKQAGIDGFIVSWKSTPTARPPPREAGRGRRAGALQAGHHLPGPRLRAPAAARRTGRRRLRSVHQAVRRRSRSFNIFGKPVVIWSGTWKFTRRRDRERRRATTASDLLILASEKNAARLRCACADLVDGDAYYWSSVNPDTYPGYAGEAAARWERPSTDPAGSGSRRRRPASTPAWSAGPPWCRARTARRCARRWTRPLESSPDAIGLISWNEFSENSHVEPSEKHGARYLRCWPTSTAQRSEPRWIRAQVSPEGASHTACPCSWGLVVFFLGRAILLKRRTRSRTHG